MLFRSHFLTTETFPYPSVLVASQANLSFFILYVLAFSLYLIRFVNQRFPILEESIFIVSLAVIVCVIFNTLRLCQTGIWYRLFKLCQFTSGGLFLFGVFKLQISKNRSVSVAILFNPDRLFCGRRCTSFK